MLLLQFRCRWCSTVCVRFTYADVCYTVCVRLTYADVCGQGAAGAAQAMRVTYADVCCMLTYADVCSQGAAGAGPHRLPVYGDPPRRQVCLCVENLCACL